MRALSSVVIGLALAVLVVGLSLYPLTHPTFTRLLVDRFSLSAPIGLSQSRIEATAEQVRAFVADGDGISLPETVDGRPGFDAAAVAHLADVRGVISAARTLTGILAAVVAAWLAFAIAKRRFDYIWPALFVGALGCVVFVVLGAAAGVLDFDALFTWFHGLFFSAGTWQFPADSLLIEVFPEQFWATAAAVWAGLVLLGGVVLATAGVLVRGGLSTTAPQTPEEDSSARA